MHEMMLAKATITVPTWIYAAIHCSNLRKSIRR